MESSRPSCMPSSPFSRYEPQSFFYQLYSCSKLGRAAATESFPQKAGLQQAEAWVHRAIPLPAEKAYSCTPEEWESKTQACPSTSEYSRPLQLIAPSWKQRKEPRASGASHPRVGVKKSWASRNTWCRIVSQWRTQSAPRKSVETEHLDRFRQITCNFWALQHRETSTSTAP